TRPSITSKLQPYEPAFKWVNLLDADAPFKPRDEQHGLAGTGPGDECTSQYRLDVLRSVVGLPRCAVSLFPILFAHSRVSGHGVIEIILVQVRVHRYSGDVEIAMVLGSRQRSEIKEFEKINRQLSLNNSNVMKNRFRGVARKAENVAAIGHYARALPFQKHLAILGALILALLRA